MKLLLILKMHLNPMIFYTKFLCHVFDKRLGVFSVLFRSVDSTEFSFKGKLAKITKLGKKKKRTCRNAYNPSLPCILFAFILLVFC